MHGRHYAKPEHDGGHDHSNDDLETDNDEHETDDVVMKLMMW